MPILHYIHDPLCGWCYAASPLVEAAAAAGIAVRLHGGGLWDAPTALPPAKRAMIAQADARIAGMTGQPFGEAYLQGLLQDPATRFHSRPTIAALLAVPEAQALPMLRAIQRAHYVEGQRVIETPVLARLAEGLGVAPAEFLPALEAAPVDRHIETTRGLMQRIGAGGFPTFLVERDGVARPLPHQDCYGNPALFVQRILN
ncbi:DsbA family protein [Pseudoroseomonas cervicalis]|uniref:DsbA family protein n=1 Tax=Teichococcus cervicalis TaxID=204525 RepID=UPI0022F16783|nr:DsbA family protein [Pseudoroseomonas cervicalis]WBV43653.1 DsbA family protein [Pseudoroseomonas cervicalis]